MLTLALLSLSLPSAADLPPQWTFLPTASYGTDEGIGGGFRVSLDRLDGHTDPYVSSTVVQLYASTLGYQYHRFRYDRLGLGASGALRLTAWAAYRQWRNDGYWGNGPQTAIEADFSDTSTRSHDRYLYTLQQPFARVNLRRELGGPWAAFGMLDAHDSYVEAQPGSLLAAEQPHGLEGGLAIVAGAGLLYDTRQPEISPHAGVLLEAAGRYAPAIPGVTDSVGGFGGAFASWRGFTSPSPRIVLAGRLMGDAMVGDVPFYEQMTWGGLSPILGFGGSDTLRGVPYGRWRGLYKTVANAELRADVVVHPFRGQEVRWQAVPFLDAGATWGGAPSANSTADTPVIHPAAGLGGRLVYGSSFVGRLDVGVSPDWVQRADGTLHASPETGFYLVFDHMF